LPAFENAVNLSEKRYGTHLKNDALFIRDIRADGRPKVPGNRRSPGVLKLAK
jgi:hypothetical protein